jgi:hypothetical protein
MFHKKLESPPDCYRSWVSVGTPPPCWAAAGALARQIAANAAIFHRLRIAFLPFETKTRPRLGLDAPMPCCPGERQSPITFGGWRKANARID